MTAYLRCARHAHCLYVCVAIAVLISFWSGRRHTGRQHLPFARYPFFVVAFASAASARDVVSPLLTSNVAAAKVPHSPQRLENTVGLVIERRRSPQNIDRCVPSRQDDRNRTAFY